MSSRQAFHAFSGWWRALPQASLLVPPTAGLALASKQSVSAEQRPEPDATLLKEHHLSTWKSQFVADGLVDEPQVNRFQNPMAVKYPDKKFQGHDDQVQSFITNRRHHLTLKSTAVRANATKDIFWNPAEVKVAIVTCGGLCPGLNSIVREVTRCLIFQYGVHEVYGYTDGFNGLAATLAGSGKLEHCQQTDFRVDVSDRRIKLDDKFVRTMHLEGGSKIRAGRGGFEPFKICNHLQDQGINMLFVVGGDGTQWAGDVIYQAARDRGMNLSVIGVPKSIDNDVLFIDRTFGFETAVHLAADVLRHAWVEARSQYRGVSIVRLMGRDAGFIAMRASLGSSQVDCCLIPEVKWKMEDLKKYVDETLDRKGYMVIVVAEGAGQEHVATGQKDASGHEIYGDIGVWLKKALDAHLKPSGGRTFYIDPSYIIRSGPAIANDHGFCTRLAHDAVHVAMRGYTGVCVGAVNDMIAIIPSKFIAMGQKQVNLSGSPWMSCVEVCKMPQSLSGFDSAGSVAKFKERGRLENFKY